MMHHRWGRSKGASVMTVQEHALTWYGDPYDPDDIDEEKIVLGRNGGKTNGNKSKTDVGRRYWHGRGSGPSRCRVWAGLSHPTGADRCRLRAGRRAGPGW